MNDDIRVPFDVYFTTGGGVYAFLPLFITVLAAYYTIPQN